MMTCTGQQRNHLQIQCHQREQVQLEEESLKDMVLTIKSGLSTKKTRKSAMKQPGKGERNKADNNQKDSPTIASQATSISQLTEQVNKIKQTNKTSLACFDQLAEQMAALLATSQPQDNTQCQARGHSSGSGQPKWCQGAVQTVVRTTAMHVAQGQWNPPTMMDPVPALDEEISDPGHQTMWGQHLGKNNKQTSASVFRT